MIDLLVKEDDSIVIPCAVAKTTHGAIVCDTNAAILQQNYENLVTEAIEEHQVFFKLPSFKNVVDLSTEFSVSADRGLDFNPTATRYEKMRKLIKSWTFKDAEGSELPATPENIDALHPIIANYLGAELDIQTPSL